MINVEGIFENGQIKMFEKITSKKPVRIIITFPDSVQTEKNKGLRFEDFNFAATRESLKNINTNFSNEVLKERSEER